MLMLEPMNEVPLQSQPSSVALSDMSSQPSSVAPTRPSSPFSFLTLLADTSLHDANKRPRQNSSADTKAARANSPSAGKYQCLKCARTYASTDACRKHARQTHPEWIKEQGQGCPSLYCMVVEGASPKVPPVASPVSSPPMAPTQARAPPKLANAIIVGEPVRPVASVAAPVLAAVVMASTAPAVPAAPVAVAAPVAPTPAFRPSTPPPAADSAAHLLVSAAESCVALSMAAHSDDESPSLPEGLTSPPRSGLGALLAASAHTPPRAIARAAPPAVSRQGSGGIKRPRSVRCGQCPGCVGDDCGMCKNCVDKPKFGGLGMRKQGCVRKICHAPRAA